MISERKISASETVLSSKMSHLQRLVTIYSGIYAQFFSIIFEISKNGIYAHLKKKIPSEKLKNPFFSACGASKTVFSSFPTSKTFLRVFLLQLWWKGSISAPSIHEERCFCALESQHESGIYEPPKSIIFEIFKNGIYAKRNIWSPSAVQESNGFVKHHFIFF